MNLVFSEVYQPLFDLLVAREKAKESKYYKELSKVHTVLMSGGRDSGKSFALSCFNLIAARDYNHRILYTRQTMSSTDNSITEALEKRMLDFGMGGDFEVSGKDYIVKDGIGKISITGQKTSVGTQTAKLKSLEDFSIFETDEGEELESYANWKKVKRSMRAKDVQTLSIISFNPPTFDHWLYTTFYEGLPEGFNGIKNGILYIHSTYLDNGKENMTETNWNEYEDLRKNYELYLSTDKSLRESLPNKIKKDYNEYKHEILGSFKNRAEGIVITNWTYGDFNPDNLQTYFGQDYGFSNDPTTLVEVAIDKKKKKIYAKEHLYKAGLNTQQIKDINKAICGNRLIVGDCAEPRLISELQSACQILPAIKGQGSITAGVMILQDYEIVVEHNSHNLVKEFNNWCYADKGSATYMDNWNHLIDALRYIVYFILRNNENLIDLR